MTIISLSLNQKILDQLDKIKEEQGYSGRSEVIRTAIRLLLMENKNREKLKGKINAILMLIHHSKCEHIVSIIKHKFEKITTTQLHTHLKENKCMEIFLLDGDSEQIKNMVRQFETSGKIEYVKLIVA